jgi:hypothetical protein
MIRSPTTARSCLPDLQEPGRADRGADRRPRADDDAWRQGRGCRADRCRGDCPEHTPCGGGLRLHLLDPEVRERVVGGRRRRGPGADRGGASSSGCGGGCVHGARGCSHPHGRNRRGRRGCAGRCHRAHRDRVRSLRLPRRRPPPPHARRHQQQGQDRPRREVALARRQADARRRRRALRTTRSRVRRPHDPHLRRLLGGREMGRDRNPAWAITGVPEELVAEFSTRARHIDAEKTGSSPSTSPSTDANPRTRRSSSSEPKPR